VTEYYTHGSGNLSQFRVKAPRKPNNAALTDLQRDIKQSEPYDMSSG